MIFQFVEKYLMTSNGNIYTRIKKTHLWVERNLLQAVLQNLKIYKLILGCTEFERFKAALAKIFFQNNIPY